VLGILAVILTGEKWYWAYWPFDPATVYSIRVTNPDKLVCAGTEMTYDVDIDKKMDVPVTVKRTLVNSYEIVLKPEQPAFRGFGRKTYPQTAPVGNFTERGDWHMDWTADYQVGPKKRIISRHGKSDTYWVVDCD